MISAASIRQPGTWGQLPLDTYTIITLGFKVADDKNAIIQSLENALAAVYTSFPFLAGNIVREGRSNVLSGTYSIRPSNPSPTLIVKDRSAHCRPFEEILNSCAPFSMLDGGLLSPVNGFGYQYDFADNVSVFVLQANFVRGGLLLTFASMHNAIDMNGQGQLLKLFSCACQGLSFTPEEIAVGNRDPDTLIPRLKGGEQPLCHDILWKASALDGPPPEPPAFSAAWEYWRMSKDNLRKLKALAMPSDTWISTDDALTAFVAQRVTAIRLKACRFRKDEAVMCLRGVNGRRRLDPPLSDAYMGHLVVMSDSHWEAGHLADATLATIARDIRQNLAKIDDYHVRSLTTVIHEEDDKTKLSYAAKCRTGIDIVVSSWAGLGLADLEFGPLLGKPDFVRRPNLNLLPDLVYIMPKTSDGHIDLGVCLLEVDSKALREDEMWSGLAKYIG